jgi:chromosome segregation ATPase
MAHSMDKSIQKTRFAIADLQKRITVLEATREDLERQIRKLNDSVPEDSVDPNAQKEGYVAYGSYANSVIARKENIRRSLNDITDQTSNLSEDLRIALDSLDSFERVRARQMAAKAEKAMARRAG